MDNMRPPPPLELGGDKTGAWRIFKRRWNNFALITKLDAKTRDYQVALFENCLGDEAMRLYEGFHFKTNDDVRTLKEIIEAYDNFTVGETNVTVERYTFNKRIQEEGEQFNAFYNQLRVLVKPCDFCEACVDSMLRDRIVLGIRSPEVRQELLKNRQLTLDQSLDICRAAESAVGQRSMLDQPAIHLVRGNTSHNGPSCHYCGSAHVKGKEHCPAYGKVCSKCSRKHHFASMCQQRQPVQASNRPKRFHPKKQNSSRWQSPQHQHKSEGAAVHQVSNTDSWVYSVSQNRTGADAKCRMLINGKPVIFQIDTGASVNMLPAKYATDVKPYSGLLSMWDKSLVQPKGRCAMSVTNPRTKERYKVDFIVFDGDMCQPIMGLETSQTMHLVSINDESFQRVSAITDNTRFSAIFNGDLGCLPGAPHHLTIDPNMVPRIMPDRRVPIAVRPVLKEELDRMTQAGVIMPVDQPTPWVSQLVVTKKKSGGLRVCIDPHELNKSLCRERFTLPVLEDLLHELKDSKVFSKADLKSGYWHIALDDESCLLTTFQTCYGRYCFKRLPFGTCVSSEVFQKRLLLALEGLRGVLCIADDIVIHGVDKADHDANMLQFLERCVDSNIKLNREKFELCVNEVVFMGHKITSRGLCVDPEKVSAINNMAAPNNISELRRFIGMTNYLSRFIPDMTREMQPLHQLLRKDVTFLWSPCQQAAFDRIKGLLTTAPILAFYDPSQPLELENDSSEYGIGSVMTQQGKPLAYASRSLSDTEQRYAQIEKEMLAVVFGLCKFHQYTYGRDVSVTTDHKPLVSIKLKPLSKAPRRLQQMLLKAQEYTYTLSYKRGKDLFVSDTLSRAPTGPPAQADLQVNNLTLTGFEADRLDRIRGATAKDDVLQNLSKVILAGWPDSRQDVQSMVLPYFSYRDELTVQDGVVFRGERIVVPTSLRGDMKQRVHAGHLGINSCLRRAKDLLFWPQMTADIRHYVETCGVCSTFSDRQPAESPIVTPTPSIPWQQVGIDLFSWGGKQYLITMDYHSRYFEMDYLQTTVAETVVDKLKAQFSRHGIPDTVVTDNGPQFCSGVFQKFATTWQFNHTTSSPYHSQGNGAAEAAVKVCKRLLRKCQAAGDDPYLGLLNARNTPSEGSEYSPVQRMFGRRTRTLVPVVLSKLCTDIPGPVHTRTTRRLVPEPTTMDLPATRDLPAVHTGDTVRIQPTVGREWQQATVERQLSARSYAVVTPSGKRFRRNRRQLRLSAQSEHDIVPDAHSGSQPVLHPPDTDPPIVPSATDTPIPSTGTSVIPEESIPSDLPGSSPEKRSRYGRIIKPCIKLSL